MRYLITGADGFVGLELTQYLREMGHEVWALIRNRETKTALWNRIFYCDLECDSIPSDAMEDVFGVFHLANIAHTVLGKNDLYLYRKVNVDGTKAVLDAAVSHDVKRFVYFSSIKAREYKKDLTTSVDLAQIHEDTITYVESKFEAEKNILSAGVKSNIHVSVIRPSLIYGKGVKGNLAYLLRQARGKKVQFVTGQKYKYSMVSIKDVVKVAYLLMTNDKANGQIYSITDWEPYSLKDIVQSVGYVEGMKKIIISVPDILLLSAGKVGDLYERVLPLSAPFNSLMYKKLKRSDKYSSELLVKDFNWRPSTTFYKSITDIIKSDETRITHDFYDVQKVDCFGEQDLVNAELKDVSVVIVNYNSGGFLSICIESVKLCRPREIVIVDNGSTDESLSYLKYLSSNNIKVILNKRNLGFAAANNIGIGNTTSSSILFLNPDCVLIRESIENMLKVLEIKKEIGMVGALICDKYGFEQHGARRRFPTPLSSFVHFIEMSWLKRFLPKTFVGYSMRGEPITDKPTKVESISGACMLVKREAIEDVGLWDEGYFLHCEDIDWCMRFKLSNWDVVFSPNAIVPHEGGVSSSSRPYFVQWHKHLGMIRFFNKYYRKIYIFPINVIVLIGVYFHLLFAWLKIFLRNLVSH